MGYQRKRLVIRIITTIIVGIFALMFIFPFLWMLSTSFKYEIDVMEFPVHLIPQRWNFQNYVTVFTKSDFPGYYLNSIKVTFITIIGELCITTMAAYAFARLKFRGKKILFMVYLSTMMVPGQVLLLPKYIYFQSMHITNTHLALILPGLFSVFGVLLMRQVFMQIPFEYTEAAYLDGATRFQVFTKVTIPLSKPIIVYTTLSAFLGPWLDFIFAKVICRANAKYYTVALGLWKMLEKEYIDSWYTCFAAGAVCISVPIAILFVVMQRYYTDGLSGAVKG